MALERLQQDAQRNLQSLVSTASVRRAPSDIRDALTGAGRRLREAVAAPEHSILIEELYATLLTLCQLLAGRGFAEDEALGFAFMHNPALGLGLWFASEVRSRLEALRGTDLLEIDALLEMYFLASYRETTEEEE